MRRSATVLETALLTAGVTTAVAPAATAAGIVPRDLTITATGLGTAQRTCSTDADLHVPPGVDARRPTPAVLATHGFGGTEDDLFAELYDVGPDGAVELPSRLISPARVADVTTPVTVELPGIVHRFEPGHRLAVVLAGGTSPTAARRCPSR